MDILRCYEKFTGKESDDFFVQIHQRILQDDFIESNVLRLVREEVQLGIEEQVYLMVLE